MTGTASGGDYATLKYNSSGVQQWVEIYDGPGGGNDQANSISVDGSGNVYVTGYSTGTGTGHDYATIKYSQTVGVIQITGEIPKNFSLSQNYPNPFNPNTTIRYELPKSSHVTLKVYNLLGQEVVVLFNENLLPGRYQVSWNASAFASGVYFYRLQAKDFVETKKLILLK